MFYPFCWCPAPWHLRTPRWPCPLFCAFSAATDVLSATRGDPKTPGAGDPARGPGQTIGTRDQKLEDELTMVLSRGLCPPRPQGHHRLHGEVQNQTISPPRTTTISIFFTRKQNSVTERFPVGHGAVFLFAFSKQQCLNWLFLDDTLPSVEFCCKGPRWAIISQGKEPCRELELEGPSCWTCLWFLNWVVHRMGGGRLSRRAVPPLFQPDNSTSFCFIYQL